MAAPPASFTGARQKSALSAERIAAEALSLIDSEGLEGFSFRTLAARLSCKAMSLYHYYPSKAHLFEALIDICIAEIVPPSADGWRERIRVFAQAFRQIALRHPGFYIYFATFRMNNRAGLGLLNQILKAFEETGLPAELRARHFRAMGYFLAGAGIEEALGYDRGPSSVNPVSDAEVARLFPAILAVGPYFAPKYRDMTFDAGLDALLDAIAADIARAQAGPTPAEPPARG